MQAKLTPLIQKLEKLFRLDIGYIARGGFWLGIGQGIAAISGLLLSVAFANLIPKDVFGTYKFVLALVGVAGAFTLTGLMQALTRAVARGNDGALSHGFRTQVIWSIPVVLILLAGSFYYYINDNNILSTSLLIAALAAPLRTSTHLYASLLDGKKLFKQSTFFNAIRTVTSAAAIIATLFVTDNVVIVIAVYFLSTIIPNSLIFLYVKKKYAPKKEVTAAPMVSYGKHLSLMNILGKVSSHADKILIFHFLGAVELAIYAFAVAVPNQVKNFNKILSTLALPKFSEQELSNIKRFLPRKLFLAFGLGLVLTIGYVLVAPFIYTLLFPQYLDAILYSQVFALSLLFMPNPIMKQLLVAQRKQKALYIVQTLVPSIRIALLATLLPLYGLWGGIAALLITRVINSITLGISIHRS